MSNHPYNQHREHQVSHRRVDHILKHEPAGSKKHAHRSAFSKVTSKTAAERHDDISGRDTRSRFARGGRAKHKGPHTNVNIVVPQGQHPPMAPPPGGPMMPPPRPPMAGLPPGGPPGGAPMPPPGLPPGPGMPMRAAGGRIKESAELTKGQIAKSAKRAKENSFMRGGAATGVGRLEQFEEMKGKKRK